MAPDAATETHWMILLEKLVPREAFLLQALGRPPVEHAPRVASSIDWDNMREKWAKRSAGQLQV